MPEQYKTRMARAVVNRVLADPVGNDLRISDRMHLALCIRLEVHPTMPAPVEGYGIDAVRAFELVNRVHHRIGVGAGRDRETCLGQKRWADDHDRYRVWLYPVLLINR